jgi:hypothetical protein
MCSLRYNIPALPFADRCRGVSLSSTLASRMMLRLRSDGNRNYCDSGMTEQTTVLVLSELSGELSSVPPSVSVHLGVYGNEENPELKRDWDWDRDHERRSMQMR